MDVDTVLLSVQERDNWRRRLELLEQTLDEIRARRARVELRVKRIKKALQKAARTPPRPPPPSYRSPSTRTVHASDAQHRAR